MHYNFAAESFHTEKVCSRLPSTEMQFYSKNGHFAFLSPPFWEGGLDAMALYAVDFRLIGKSVVNFLLVIMKLFSLSATAEVLRVNIE